jgi:outer membrane protein
MSIGRRLGALGACFCAAGVAAFSAVPARAETLADALALAYQTNPVLQGQRATQRALDETYVQARSGYNPTASVQGTVTTDSNNETFSTSVGSIPGQSQTSTATLTVTQPIYTGGLVSSEVNAANADVLAGREQLRQVEESVLQAVITAYVDVRRDQESLAIAQENVTVLKRQQDEAKARFDVGEITRTDVAQTDARLAAAQAQLSTAQAQLTISRAAYAEVVGQNPADLAPEPPLERLMPATVDQAFDAAEHNNPQIRQADYAEQGAAARVAEAKAQTRPTVALRGSAGYQGGNLGVASPFANYTHDLNATAVVTFPLFTGGLTSSEIRQAAERDNVARIAVENVRRLVLQQVAQDWSQLLGARANLVANQEQVRATSIAFEGTRQEAQVGLRTTLDVLNAEQELRNAELALVNARHDEYVAASAVLAAMGSLFVSDLTSGVPNYDPKTNFDHVRHAIGWMPWTPAVEAIDRIGAPSIIQAPPASAPIGAASATPSPALRGRQDF